MWASVLLTPLACQYSGELLNSGRITGTSRKIFADPYKKPVLGRNRHKFKLNTHCDAGGDVAQVAP